MSLVRRCALVALSFVLAMVSSLAIATPASAATCYGDYCSNQDPQATGCSAGGWTQTAVDVYARTNPFGMATYAGRLELRGSNTCGSTQWVRFTPVYGGFTYKIRAEQPETGYTVDWQNGAEWQTAWSNQIYSPTKCVRGHIYTNTWLGQLEYYTPCL